MRNISYQVLKQLVRSDSPELFIVADDDQMIYQWNGASPERFKEWRHDFEIKELQLPENYRCPVEVIEIANRLIANNLSRSQNKQKLRSAKAHSGNTSVWDSIYTNIKSNYGEEQLSLHLLLQELDLNSKTPEPPKNAIRCYTIHAAKGLEFKQVYLIGLVEEQLPSWGAVKKGNNSHEIQEERRNCFVAITRAEISLTLSYADNYFGWTKKPSRFLPEMGLVSVAQPNSSAPSSNLK
ncbi:MAG: 3'-5' exonuclease [Candidatus Parabeggiatoa sp.]|nr:3'-5' exonuclease [Candidatus Parabeggiatoa sp.]